MNIAPQKIDSPDYYDHDQTDILRLVNRPVDSILEIGCATGNMLRHYIDAGASRVTGVEYVPSIAEIAQSRNPKARVFSGDVDLISVEDLGDEYDLLLANFVLEHVTDPWRTLRRLNGLLKEGGQFVGALPNVRHWSVTLPLIFKGKWEYVDEGIMDRTHYRFFSRTTIAELLKATGFKDIQINPSITAPKSKLGNALTLGLAADHFAFAFQFSATKA